MPPSGSELKAKYEMNFLIQHTALYSIFLENFIAAKLVKKCYTFMEPKCSLLDSQKCSIGPYPEPIESSL